MNLRLGLAALALIFAPQPAPLHAQGSGDWIAISDPAELKAFLSGKSLADDHIADYYRADGAMGYFNKEYKTVVVRKWVVGDDGLVCTYIYVKPDKLVDCTRYFRSASDPDLFKMLFTETGSSAMVKIDDPPLQILIDEVTAKAGPEG